MLSSNENSQSQNAPGLNLNWNWNMEIQEKNVICTSWDVLLSQKKWAEECHSLSAMPRDLQPQARSPEAIKKILLFSLHKPTWIYASRISTNWIQALPDKTIHLSTVQIMYLRCVYLLEEHVLCTTSNVAIKQGVLWIPVVQLIIDLFLKPAYWKSNQL